MRNNSNFKNIAAVIIAVIGLIVIMVASSRSAKVDEAIYRDRLKVAKEYVVKNYEPERETDDIRVALGPRGCAYWIIGEDSDEVLVNDNRDLVVLINDAVDAQTKWTGNQETAGFCAAVLLIGLLFGVVIAIAFVVTAIREHRKM